MARTDVSAAANASLAQIVEYAPDRRGAGFFAALSGAHRGTLNRAPAVIETHGQHHGYMRPLQAPMRGLAPLGMGTARPVVESTSQLSDERSALLDSPAMRIFAERMKRGGPA